MPRLTIGMPVYNNARTIRASLDSLLAQTFADFELVISDNGSTDETGAICAAYAARDSRVRVIRQPVNLGPSMNFRAVLFEARTEYFMWAAGDDLWAPSFAERQIAALDADPALVMSQSQVLFTVDDRPVNMALGTYALTDTPQRNVARYFANPADNSRYYAVWRTEILQRVFPPRPFYALDWAVSAATLRHGRHNEIPEILMIRDSSDAASYANAVAKDHRFVLWRVFPLLFMTLWLVRRRMIPLTPDVLWRLAKTNLYLHFRFGAYRIDALARRYLEGGGIRGLVGAPRSAAGAARTGLFAPGLRGRLLRGAERLARPVWNALPLPLAAREALKARGFRVLGAGAQQLDAYAGWANPNAAVLPATPPLTEPMDRVCVLRPPAGPPALTVVLLARSAVAEALNAAAALQRLSEAVDIEVILAATPAARFVLGRLVPGAATVDGGATMGALMNAAVARAKAPRVLMLRADCWYDAGLGAAVLDALDQAPLVAPQMLAPDGKLVAAGGIVTPEGLARYGAGEVPAHPDFAFARACDTAPLALALRTDAATVPFDAAIDDVDLAVADFCLNLRDTAGPPLYWPFARIVCASPSDAPALPAAMAQRHAALLAADARAVAEGRMAHDRTRAKRLLYIDSDTPTPDQNAGSIEAVNLMRIFGAFGYRVTFIPESNFVHRGRYTEDLQRMGVRAIHFPFARTGREVLSAATFDVVVPCRVWIAESYVPLARELAPDARIVFNTVDLHFLREQREAEVRNEPAALAKAAESKRNELAIIRACDVSIVLSTVERDILARDAPEARVHVLPLVRDIPARLDAPGPQGRRDVMFIGTYQHPPNEDAVLFFAREVWPLVRPRLPGAKFLIVGSSVTPAVAALACEHIEVAGFVEDLDPLLRGCRVSVAPLRYGAGLKGKVGTTLQAGLPTVATDIAAEGMGLADGVEVLIANTPVEIADAVVRLYTDDALWRALSQAGFAFVRRSFSMETNLPKIAAILADAGA